MTFVIMVPLLLVFGEVTPKTIAVSNPVRISAGLVASPLNLWVRLITPLRSGVRFVSDRITTLIVGEEKTADNILHIDEFRTLVEAVWPSGPWTVCPRSEIRSTWKACRSPSWKWTDTGFPGSRSPGEVQLSALLPELFRKRGTLKNDSTPAPGVASGFAKKLRRDKCVTECSESLRRGERTKIFLFLTPFQHSTNAKTGRAFFRHARRGKPDRGLCFEPEKRDVLINRKSTIPYPLHTKKTRYPT